MIVSLPIPSFYPLSLPHILSRLGKMQEMIL